MSNIFIILRVIPNTLLGWKEGGMILPYEDKETDNKEDGMGGCCSDGDFVDPCFYS